MTETVTPQREPENKGGMGIFGWLMFLGMLVLMIPLITIYLLLKLYEFVTNRDTSDSSQP
jgi:hypothetical protein